MRNNQYELVDEEDPYGPGSDLVLSLFAMALLLVGLIGSGESMQHAVSTELQPVPELVAATAEIENQKHQNLELTQRLDAERLQRSNLEKELIAKRAEVKRISEQLVSSAQSTGSLSEKLERLQRRLDAATVELANLKSCPSQLSSKESELQRCEIISEKRKRALNDVQKDLEGYRN